MANLIRHPSNPDDSLAEAMEKIEELRDTITKLTTTISELWKAYLKGEEMKMQIHASKAEIDIHDERVKQKAKHPEEKDDEHKEGMLALQAQYILEYHSLSDTQGDDWGICKKHCKDTRKLLVIAAALLVAEIERMDRNAG